MLLPCKCHHAAPRPIARQLHARAAVVRAAYRIEMHTCMEEDPLDFVDPVQLLAALQRLTVAKLLHPRLGEHSLIVLDDADVCAHAALYVGAAPPAAAAAARAYFIPAQNNCTC